MKQNRLSELLKSGKLPILLLPFSGPYLSQNNYVDLASAMHLVYSANCSLNCCAEQSQRVDHFALRPQKRGGLLGTGTGGEGDERVKARPRIPPEKDRRDRGPPPEQWKY